MKKRARLTVALILLAWAWALPGFSQEATLGTVLREKPDSVGEYLVGLQDGHTLQRGDVVALRRTGQQPPLGEAFVVQIQANQAVISLKGDFPVRPGDTLVFLRRPSGSAASARAGVAQSGAGGAELQGSAEVVHDPTGNFSLKLPEGWTVVPQTTRPDALLLAGPSEEALFLGSLKVRNPAEVFRTPESRAKFGEFMTQYLHQHQPDMGLVPLQDVTMFGRQGLGGKLTQGPGGLGSMVILPGRDYVFVGLALAPTPEALRQAEAMLGTVRLR